MRPSILVQSRAHQIEMVEELTRLPDAEPLLDVANDVAGIDLVDQIRREGPVCLRRNEVVSGHRRLQFGGLSSVDVGWGGDGPLRRLAWVNGPPWRRPGWCPTPI